MRSECVEGGGDNIHICIYLTLKSIGTRWHVTSVSFCADKEYHVCSICAKLSNAVDRQRDIYVSTSCTKDDIGDLSVFYNLSNKKYF